MKLYLAAKFGHKVKMQHYRDLLVNDGHEVTSRWIDVEPETDDDNGGITEAIRSSYAQMDVDDVLAADVLVAFSHPRSAPSIGGGRHVEFGIALQAGKPIVVVGPKGEHIFHWCKNVAHVEDIDGLAAWLNTDR